MTSHRYACRQTTNPTLIYIFLPVTMIPARSLLSRRSHLLRPLSRRTNRGPLQRTAASTLATLSSSEQTNSSSNNSAFHWLAAAALTLAGVATSSQFNVKKTDCCGIVGVVGRKEHGDAREFLLDGLTILKNRGYDSAGIVTLSPEGGDLHITKYASDGDKADSINLVRDHSKTMGHSLGIAHTRWATHGGKTDENAHPHVDSSGKIALVHNGTINNANELRR
jgi:glucosamine--fructose-6-phosphate aminotransferase (isomerizing)